jgi:para-aminobenzoate synthetase component 1
VPFVGGWVGFVSYEAGMAVEGIRPTTAADVALPAICFALYDTVAVFDRFQGRWYAVGVDWPAGCGIDRPPVEERLAEVRAGLEAAGAAPPIAWEAAACPPPVPTITRQAYLDSVRRAKRYIEAGDVYQVNLTRRFTTTTTATPLELYRRLRRANPSNFAALLQWGDQAVISSSPELFLDLRDGLVVTRPIKGTRPRTGDPALDSVRRGELAHSEKDRAELTMIVDLLRNDLGRVCRFGSVRVRSAAELEEHPTVYHLVGTVEGRLRPECGWVDLLRAAMPGGSITGAPKIRAMQIIDELEPACRSVYCGSIGYVGLDGSMCLNIAIRTMVMDRGKLHLFAGGGIVADSDPEDEYEETLAKAAGMLRALGHGAAWSTSSTHTTT